jgi:hypothetical protein
MAAGFRPRYAWLQDFNSPIEARQEPNMADEMLTGGCSCGRVRYQVTVADHDAYLCHCRMCQRATGSISIAFKNVKAVRVRWDGEPDWYQSSPIAERPYCSQCGTSLGFRFKEGSENMDLTVASFDDPSRFRPKHHFGAESIHSAWLDTSELPKKRTEDYAPLVEKWVEATGKLPE